LPQTNSIYSEIHLITASADGKRAAAVEVLLSTTTAEDLITRIYLQSIKGIVSKSEKFGMQTFGGALYHL
jgi:twitching motility protein PilU